MYSKTVKIKDYPILADALKRAIRDYRKQSAIIIKANSVTPHGTYWDGGSRSSYMAFTLFGKPVEYVPAPNAPAQFGGTEPAPYPIADHVMVLETGVFRGKPSTVTIYLRSPAALGIEWES